MQILICPGNFNCVVGDLMTELKDQLSIVYPRIIVMYDNAKKNVFKSSSLRSTFGIFDDFGGGVKPV